MYDYSQRLDACKSGAQQQEDSIRLQMWTDIQSLKQDVRILATDIKKLHVAINYINDFLKKAYP